MGKYSDMAAQRALERPAEEAASKARRAASKAAYESSGAAKQMQRMANEPEDRPGTAAVPTAEAGSMRGKAKDALEMELQMRPFDGTNRRKSFGENAN